MARQHPAQHDKVRAGPDGLGHVAGARAAAVLQSGLLAKVSSTKIGQKNGHKVPGR